MKHISGFLLLLMVGLLVPTTTQALSCVDPRGMIDYYVEGEEYTIFTATAGETQEHNQTKRAGLSVPGTGEDGYTGQLVEVSTVHKGMMDSRAWVYYQKDSTWGYLCTNQPPKPGVESLYIISNNNGSLDLPQVVNVYPVDNELAGEILTALANDGEEGYLNTQTTTTLKDRVATALRDIIFIARIKLAEWRFWSAQ